MSEFHEPERRQGYKEIAKTIDERMLYLENCFQRWLRRGLVAMAIIGTATTISIFGFGAVLSSHKSQNDDIQKLALQAQAQSQTAVQTVLAKEKVCADSSDVFACRALFERLKKSVTENQRYQLGCAAIKNLKGETAKKLREDNPKCGG